MKNQSDSKHIEMSIFTDFQSDPRIKIWVDFELWHTDTVEPKVAQWMANHLFSMSDQNIGVTKVVDGSSFMKPYHSVHFSVDASI
jgi:hypothetical protein